MNKRNGITGLVRYAALAFFASTAHAVATPPARNADTLPAALIGAEQAVARKLPEAAALFEHASHVAGESATAEVGMVRAYMASGQYRRALAFAHLVHGEHTGSNEALAWTAYLIDRSGQTGIALHMLEVARATQMEDVALLCAQSEIFIDRQQAARAITELDAWLARNAAQPPVIALRHRASIATGDSVSESAWRKLQSAYRPQRTLTQLATRDAEASGTWIVPWFDEMAPGPWDTASGLLIDESHVITALPTSHAGDAQIHVRDAQGHLRMATVESALNDPGLVLLKLDQPLTREKQEPLALTARVFPGSPFHAVGFPVAGSTYAAFPSETPGFFAPRTTGSPEGMTLGEVMPQGLAGAPVFAASGQLAGFISSDPHTGSVLPAALVFERLGVRAAPTSTRARLGDEEIYERALERVVLVAISKH